ncbi:MAG: NAD(P)/FAD-dependent oxidoreductase [Candidatus Brockarchaeota archaeon]|nr:NAD(P)/FAD-dependent oxidoreductase [Candidatus Brockarchaeota archaeon]MBO3809135.1 NAD(P)/FAD-dependent oxidoreductase [Candidatus Brockarchaeota archaeon]
MYDVCVAGAGVAGATLAREAARKGLKVFLVDKSPQEKVGDKVCGDALGSHHLARLRLTLPSETYFSIYPGIEIYSPDMHTCLSVVAEGLSAYALNRLEFGQFLLKLALDAGCEFKPETQARGLIVEQGCVKGVRLVGKNGVKQDVYAKVTVDATGASRVLSRELQKVGFDQKLDDDETLVCYREILETRTTPPLPAIYLDMDEAPGGYFWVFPEGEGRVNAGLGVAKGSANPKLLFRKWVDKLPCLKDNIVGVVHRGGGIVPARRPIDSAVWNGFIAVGDAAFMVNPLHGGGIGSSMTGGFLAAKVVAEALERGCVDEESLWGFNTEYMRSYGFKQASLDVFRVFLQGLNNELINYGLAQGLIKSGDLLVASMGGSLRLNITEKASRFFAGIGKPGFLMKLNRTVKLMEDFRQFYVDYPPHRGFDEWRIKVRGFHKRVHEEVGRAS